MPRPHGLPRWALLALACAAFFAVAMIPRGVVRTVEASHLRDTIPARADVDRFEAPAQQAVELPGVRAVVSREERDVPLVPAALGAVVPGEPAVHDVTGAPAELRGDPPPTAPQLDTAPRGSRAPPSSI